MRFELRRGTSEIALDVPEERLVGACRGSEGAAAPDLGQTIARCLESPLDAPPFESAVVPDDVVTIALDAGLPAPQNVLSPLFEHLESVGIAPSRIRIVATDDRNDIARLAERLPEKYRQTEVVVHDPEDEKQHAYLANTQDGRRIYLNRMIADADTVIVVGRAGFDPVVGLRGTASHLYPALGNRDDRTRSRRLAAELKTPSEDLRKRQGCDEVGWLSGLFYAMAIALNRDNEIEHVWFGHYPSVQKACEESTLREWTIQSPIASPDLVVAAVARSHCRATWESVSAAAETAAAVAAPDAAIVVVADLDEPPGPAGRVLMEHDNPWAVLAQLREVRADPLPMTQCARAMSIGKLHLFSDVDPALLEQMAIVPVAAERELQNLVHRCERCFIIEDADRIRVL